MMATLEGGFDWRDSAGGSWQEGSTQGSEHQRRSRLGREMCWEADRQEVAKKRRRTARGSKKGRQGKGDIGREALPNGLCGQPQQQTGLWYCELSP